MKEPRAHGFIPEPIRTEDCVFGGEWNLQGKGFKGVELVPDGNWEPYLYSLIYSHQAANYETNSCVSHGTANALELLANRMHGRTLDLSDRFIAKVSGTDPAKGNTPKTVADAIRHKWACFESEWPTDAAKSVEEFYEDIPLNLFEYALNDKKNYSFGYERIDPPTIDNLKEALKYSPVGISCALAEPGEDQLWYKPIGWRDVHWVTLLRIKDNGHFVILDSYPPYVKTARAFTPEVAMRYALDYERYDLLTQLLAVAKKLLHAIFVSPDLPEPSQPHNLPPQSDAKPKDDLIHKMALGIQEWEGYAAPGEKDRTGRRWLNGTPSWRNRNPGNIKGIDGRFRVFKTYDEGFNYLKDYIRRACTGKHPAYKPSMSIKQFFAIYAPSSENSLESISNYASYVCKKMNVMPSTKLSELV